MTHKLVHTLVFMGIIFLAACSQSEAIQCDWLQLLDTYQFKIINCTYTPQGNDFVLDIVYNTTNDNSQADKISYIIIYEDFSKKITDQMLPSANHRKGQLIVGKYLLTQSSMKPDSGLSVWVKYGDTNKLVISMKGYPKRK